MTFDTGGLSLKPAKSMEGMKYDMSGGAAVIEAMGVIAALELPISVVAVVGATENMPSGRSIQPGDIVRAMNGTTIQIDNTDAEGRLVLADCLAHAVDLGCERLVDVATLTGAIEVALGTTYAGLLSNDDALADLVADCGRSTGDLVWRLPLHPEYAEMIKGRYADIVNTTPHRKAGSITAAHFLERFVGDTPWAHLDIAGAADDAGRPYAPKGGSGYGVRLLVELASRLGDETARLTPSSEVCVKKVHDIHAFLDARIAEVAARQHGVVSASTQLRALGLPEGAVEWRARTGPAAPHPPRRLRGRPSTTDGARAVWAAVLACGGPERAVLSHALRGSAVGSGHLSLGDPRHDARAEPVDAGRPRPSGKAVEATTLDGLAVTTVAQTLLDLAATSPSIGCRRACHRAEHLRLLDMNAIGVLLAEQFGGRGTARLARAVDELATREPEMTQSPSSRNASSSS